MLISRSSSSSNHLYVIALVSLSISVKFLHILNEKVLGVCEFRVFTPEKRNMVLFPPLQHSHSRRQKPEPDFLHFFCLSSSLHLFNLFYNTSFFPCISNPLPLPLSFSHLIFFPDTLPLYFHLPPSPCILSLFCISFYALPSPSLAPSISPLQPQYVRNPQKPSSSQPSPGRINRLSFSLPSRKRQRLKATTASR